MSISMILLIGWCILILVASFLPPGSKAASAFTMGGHDFPSHAVAYGVMAALTFFTFRQYSLPVAFAVAFAGPVVFGALVEVFQPLVGRGRSLRDVLANTIGATVGLILIACWTKLSR